MSIRLCLSLLLALSGLVTVSVRAQQTSQSISGANPAEASPYTQKRTQGYTSFDNPYAAGGIYDPYRNSQMTSAGAKGNPQSSAYANTGLGGNNSIQLSGQGTGAAGQTAGSSGGSGTGPGGGKRLASKSADSCGGNQSGGGQAAGGGFGGSRPNRHQGMSGATSSASGRGCGGGGTSASGGGTLARGTGHSSGLNDMSAMNRMGNLNSQQGMGSQGGRSASTQQHQLNRQQPSQ